MKRSVIKLGSRILVPDDQLDEAYLSALSQQVKSAMNGGWQILLVTSGAIASGLKSLKLANVPNSVHMKQAVAAVGQIRLMEAYQRVFAESGLSVAQILLTHADLENRKRFLNARHTIQGLLSMGVVPLINENDSVASEEIKVGDNDNLAGMVACLVEADLLILLSDIDGLYTADPHSNAEAKLIREINELTPEIEEFASATSNPTAVGGMRTKIAAAKRAAAYKIPTVIAAGRERDVISRIFAGESVGTRIDLSTGKLKARKHWIQHVLKARGRVIVDDGAAVALRENSRSLLPSGIIKVEGSFDIGDAIEIGDQSENVFGCGLAMYSSSEIDRIKTRHSHDIERILGYRYSDEVIHRDDLVIF